MDKQELIQERTIRKAMGLAASQARFLGITARKANCEFKSTRLAQERLELSDKLTEISQNYVSALNSTKLVWKNDVCTQDYDVNYNLLMMPSAANDYNPYMVTTRSGAIILNSKYLAAAEAAGISMSGGEATQEGRDKFLAALVPGGLITQETADAISIDNYKYDSTTKTFSKNGSTTDEKLDIKGIFWDGEAGMGAEPLSTSIYDALTLADLAVDKNIGKQKIDWLQIYKTAVNETVTDGKYFVTQQEYDSKIKLYETATNNAISTFIKTVDPKDFQDKQTHYLYEQLGFTNNDDIAINVNKMAEEFKTQVRQENERIADNKNTTSGTIVDETKINDAVLKKLYDAYVYANQDDLSSSLSSIAPKRYNNLVNGMDANGNYYVINIDKDGNLVTDDDGNLPIITVSEYKNADSEQKAEYDRQIEISQLYFGIRAAALEEQMYKSYTGTKILRWADGDERTNPSKGIYRDTDVFDIKTTLNNDENKDENNNKIFEINVIQDGIKMNGEDAESIKSLTIADLMTHNIVLYAVDDQDSDTKKYVSIENVRNYADAILQDVARILGYGQIGVGINTDATTNSALAQALMMTERIFLNTNNAVAVGKETKNDPKGLYLDSAYSNAINYNRIGASEDKKRAAVSLSNMLSAFLTYYDNALRGTESPYTVGRGNDKTDDSKTYFVTSDASYTFVALSEDQIEYNERMANFYDELYNNICAYGYRRDDMVEDSEYLQNAIKDGRYSLMSLNMDGYYYQTRYSDTGYLVEEKDEAAITRAEADYTQKKAEITYKEDVLDMRTKTLDAEIAELNAEMTSVQSLITKGIEKVFQMFQSG